MPLLIVAVAVLVFVREAEREIFGSPDIGRYGVAPPEVRAEGALSQDLVAFLRQNTDRSARVFVELSLARVHDGAHMAGRYALAADRELIGGPYPYMDFASAWDNFAFGKSYGEHTPGGLAVLLDAYNVRWMICHSAECRAAMTALPGVIELAVIGPLVAYGRASSPGFVVQGQAITASCVNRIEFTAASGTPLVLRYHWAPGLVSLPSGRVEPVELVPGARPFIAIHDPPAKFSLRIGVGAGLPCSDPTRPAP